MVAETIGSRKVDTRPASGTRQLVGTFDLLFCELLKLSSGIGERGMSVDVNSPVCDSNAESNASYR